MKEQKKIHARELAAIHKEARVDNKHNVRLKNQLHSKDSKINELQLSITKLECEINKYKTGVALNKRTDRCKV